ncbi:MAG: zinc transporter ZntB [Phycisphaeraceae bacterium]|nr:zinc transporter ZntB [Phycisphaeraceae bacterium]
MSQPETAVPAEHTIADTAGAFSILRLDGSGGATALDPGRDASWRLDAAPVWLDLDRRHERVKRFIRGGAVRDRLLAEAMLAEETRPRCVEDEEGMLLILRAVNLNPGTDPEDMVAVRLWITPSAVLSARMFHLKSIADIREALQAGKGPRAIGELVVLLITRIVARLVPVIDELRETCDDLEDNVIAPGDDPEHAQVASIRRTAIVLKRYMTPQRDAMRALRESELPWLTETDRARLGEATDRLQHCVEDLEAVRERALVIQAELESHATARQGRALYTLSIVTVLFLPLGFLTGLMGMNVKVPGEGGSLGFWIAVGAMLCIVGVELWAFKRFKWL